MENRQVEAEIVILVHLFKVCLPAFLHARSAVLQQCGIAIVDGTQQLVKQVVGFVESVQLSVGLQFVGQDVVVGLVGGALGLKFVLLF